MFALAISVAPPIGAADNQDADHLHEKGVLSVTRFGAIPNDDQDDTKSIQQAMEAARDQGMVSYFPPGTYLVSDTLKCRQTATHNGKRWVQARRKPCVVVGAAGEQRAILKLMPNAPGFDDAKAPKPLIWFWAQPVRGPNMGSVDPTHDDPTISFNQVIRGLDIDLRAAGNAGAVGIRHAGSQGSTITDVNIKAQGAFAGLYDTPGQGGGIYDLLVEGGNYGIYATRKSRYPLVVGARFLGQQTSAVHWQGNVVFVMVGFEIDKQSPGPAITLHPGGPIYGRGFALVDGSIKTKDTLAIDNTANKALTLSNLYFNTEGALLKSGRNAPVANSGDGAWTHVKEYTYTGRDYVSMVDGAAQSAGYQAVDASVAPASPDATLIDRHLWAPEFPTFEDAEGVDIRRYGARADDSIDDTRAIQEALDKHAKVLIPKGRFLINRPLVLGPNNQLFGVGKTFSVLRENRRWEGDKNAPLVTTAAEANARTSLSFVMLETRSADRTPLHWKAGQASVVRDIMSGPVNAYYKKHVMGARHTYRISGTGGGRWYGVAAEWGDLHGSTYHPDYSHLLIEDTRQPLTFYGLNVERDAVWPQAVIRNAANIDIFYFKVEAAEWPKGTVPPGVLLIEGSRKIRLFGMTGNAHPPNSALIKLERSEDLLLTHVAGFQPGDKFSNLTESHSEASRSVSGQTPLAMFRRGAGAQ